MKRWLWALAALAMLGCDDGDGGGGEPADAAMTDGGAGGEGGADLGPPPEGLSIQGLSAPVEARFDAQAFLHLRCATDADCFAAQGYFHASHRFIQMDIRRRFVRGTLGEMVGSAVLEVDKGNRHRIATSDGGRVEEVMWERADPFTRMAIEAYTRGVNAWIADYRAERNGAILNDEYDFVLIDKSAIRDWEPLDSAACILALIQSLTDDSDTEIELGRVFADMDPAMARDLYGLMPASASTILPARKAGGGHEPWRWDIVRDRLRAARGALDAVRPAGRDWPDDLGSNNWIVGPGRSADGKALLANDPHLGMSNPSVWYVVHLDAKTAGEGEIHIAGASFAGLPGVILGQNEDIAWGATTTFFDQADTYVETLSEDGEGVIFNGEVVPFVKRDFTFGLTGEAPVTETMLYVPHHGPVLSVDPEAGSAISVRWTGQLVDTDLQFIMGMARADSVSAAKQVIGETITSVGQNFVVVDRQGNFGWFPYNRIPKRPWASAELPSWLPLPGDGSAEWQGFLELSDLPQAHNPERGYLATANNDMTGALWDGEPTNDGLPMLQHFTSLGFRHERITQRLEEEPKHSVESLQSIQADVHSLLGARVLPAVLAALEGAELSAGAAAVVGALEAWDLECPTGLTGPEPSSPPDAEPATAAASIGCAAFHVMWPRLVRAALFDEGHPDREPREGTVVTLLNRPEALFSEHDYWDDVGTADVVETRETQALFAVESAAEWLTENLGADPDDWRWGRIHTLTLRADLFSAAGVTMFDHGPFANDGGAFTVDVANTRQQHDDDWGHRSGPSMRFVCHAGDTMACTIDLPGGQRHFRDSPHYDDLLMRYLDNRPAPIAFSAEKVDDATVELLTVLPRP